MIKKVCLKAGMLVQIFLRVINWINILKQLKIKNNIFIKKTYLIF